MAIKKSYTDIVNFLETNSNKKVSSIIDEIYAMCESKKQSKTFIEDSNGVVVAIYCYYHKQWEIINDVPYGSKASSSTGLNTMCKLGVSMWTKQQRAFKVGEANLLEEVMSGHIQPSDIKGHKEDLEVTRKSIGLTDMPIGYANEAELMDALK